MRPALAVIFVAALSGCPLNIPLPPYNPWAPNCPPGMLPPIDVPQHAYLRALENGIRLGALQGFFGVV